MDINRVHHHLFPFALLLSNVLFAFVMCCNRWYAARLSLSKRERSSCVLGFSRFCFGDTNIDLIPHKVYDIRARAASMNIAAQHKKRNMTTIE